MAKDLFHDAVKTALIKEGWTITHDPYPLKIAKRHLFIDLGAERIVAAQREQKTIAVEIKSFVSPSPIQDLHKVVGQYMNYLIVLRRDDPNRKLFLAVPVEVYRSFFQERDIWELVETIAIPLIVYDDQQQEILHWFTFQ
jgi:hypothetical protein